MQAATFSSWFSEQGSLPMITFKTDIASLSNHVKQRVRRILEAVATAKFDKGLHVH
jgi:hypothetical protein